MTDRELLRQAVELARDNRARGYHPYGAVLAKDGQVVATGVNEMVQTCDPSTHAEMQAIRAGTRAQGSTSLAGHTMYASGMPCPMCLAALLNAGTERVVYAFDNQDAEPYGESSDATYRRLGITLQPPPLPMDKLDTGITAAQMYGDAPWPQDRAGG